MKKLYNLYEQVILEATDIEMVKYAIEHHYNVNIKYDDGSNDGTAGSWRYCQIYNIGTTSAGNTAVRVYQISGPNLDNGKGKSTRWKTLRIDRITDWDMTNFKGLTPIQAPIPFKPNQDLTLNHGNLQIKDFNTNR